VMPFAVQRTITASLATVGPMTLPPTKHMVTRDTTENSEEFESSQNTAWISDNLESV
jgi:hypothetical protein